MWYYLDMNKRYWFKGGMVSLVMTIVVCVVTNIFGGNAAVGFIGIILFLIPVSLLNTAFPGNPFGHPEYFFAEPNFLGYVLLAVLYFALGSFIGWIYGKIKNRT